jgi:hypothetical protein
MKEATEQLETPRSQYCRNTSQDAGLDSLHQSVFPDCDQDFLRVSSPNLISRLPVEILTEIFLYCLPTFHERRPASLAKLDAPLLLASICREWRSIAFNTPRLWSLLQIRLPLSRSAISAESIQTKRLGIELWLNRSRSHPLFVSFTDYRSLSRLGQKTELDELNHSGFELLKPLMQCSHRIEELEVFSLQGLKDLFRCLSATNSRLTALKSLHFRVAVGLKDKTLSHLMSQSEASMPTLQRVTIDALALVSDTTRYFTQSHSWSPNITELVLGSSSYGHSASEAHSCFGSTDILCILSQTTQLRSFQAIVALNGLNSFHSLHLNSPLLYRSEVKLPSLQKLDLRFEVPPNDAFNPYPDPDIYHFFRHMACPCLRVLSVAYAGIPSLTVVPFITWLRGKSEPELMHGTTRIDKLRQLKLEISITPQALTECLLLLPPSIRALEIVDIGQIDIDGINGATFGHTVQDSHLELLTRQHGTKDHQNVPCPCLKTFRLTVSGLLSRSCSTPRATPGSSSESYFTLPQRQGVSCTALQRFIDSRKQKEARNESQTGKSQTLRTCEVLLSPTSSSYYTLD